MAVLAFAQRTLPIHTKLISRVNYFSFHEFIYKNQREKLLSQSLFTTPRNNPESPEIPLERAYTEIVDQRRHRSYSLIFKDF